LPPHPWFEFVKSRQSAFTPANLALLRRYGVTHGIWDGPVDSPDVQSVLESPDQSLDQLVIKSPGSPAHPLWRLVRYLNPFPDARVATRVRVASGPLSLLAGVSYDHDPGTVWFQAGDQPEEPAFPRARIARVSSWDGKTAVVAHDGSCDLVMNRTYFPGWYASANDAPEQPVVRAEGGIQAVRLSGTGVSRVHFTYRPDGLAAATAVALGAVTTAGLSLLIEGVRLIRARGALRSRSDDG
jgi:hypothetical protein